MSLDQYRILRSAVTGRIPPAGGSGGELAANLTDSRLWAYNDAGVPQELITTGAGTTPGTRSAGNIVRSFRSETPGAVPPAGGRVGTLAVNAADKKIWVYNAAGNPVQITSVVFL